MKDTVKRPYYSQEQQMWAVEFFSAQGSYAGKNTVWHKTEAAARRAFDFRVARGYEIVETVPAPTIKEATVETTPIQRTIGEPTEHLAAIYEVIARAFKTAKANSSNYLSLKMQMSKSVHGWISMCPDIYLAVLKANAVSAYGIDQLTAKSW